MATDVQSGRGPPATDLLLEREADLHALSELVEAARRGRGGCLLLEGPPGVGKSALIEHAAGMAGERGLTVLQARGHELERVFSWGVARSLFEAMIAARQEPERDELLAGPARPARWVVEAGVSRPGTPASEAGFEILHGLYWLVARLAEREPLLLVVDDAQWADAPSLRFLIYVAGRLSDQPIAVVVGARAGDPGEGELVSRLAGDPAVGVRLLRALGRQAVVELVRRRLEGVDEEFCRRCFDLTAGNPFQLRALLAAVEQQAQPGDATTLPAAAELAARSLARSVLRRLGALSPAAQALARGVAVFEDDAPLHLAGALVGLDVVAALTAADELARADMLRVGDPLGFTHPLMRAAVYGQLSFGERARTHRRVARLLLEAGASSERVSAHLLESSPAGDDVVVDLLRASARRALAQGVPSSGVRYLERALREPPAEAARPIVLAEFGQAEAAAGLPDATAHLEAAIDLADEPRQRAALLLAFGRVLHQTGRLTDACAAFERGRDELGSGEAPAAVESSGRDGEGRSELAVDLEAGYLTSAMQVPDRAAQAHRRADAILAAGRPTHRAGRALASKAMVMRLWAGAPRDEILAIARRLFADGRLLQEDGATSRALVHVTGCLGFCDDYPTADSALRLMFADARRRGSVSAFAAASQLRAHHRLWTGPIPEAVLDARAAVDVWRGGRQMHLHPSAYCLVTGLLEQGRAGRRREGPGAGRGRARTARLLRRLASHGDRTPRRGPRGAG